MKQKAERVVNNLTAVLSGWQCVECIAVGEHSEMDTFDPYFAIVLDVYHTSKIPESIVRHTSFGFPGAFESAQGQTKDRFFLEGLPVRVEYKKTYEIDRMLDHSLDYIKLLKNSGTYPLYRLQKARILFSRTQWMDNARNRLGHLGDEFWSVMRQTFVTKMEHYFADLSAATISGDDFYFMISAAGFARFAAASLFMTNRCFEPSHREIDSQVRQLPLIPGDFLGCWENFIRSDSEISRSQKRGLAELIAKNIVIFR